ncbi:hypothetical protein BHE74_00039746 [Ensete ventricosum]|nr:hypothetical protein BHE74_00039746 [Ensete ventricosum]
MLTTTTSCSSLLMLSFHPCATLLLSYDVSARSHRHRLPSLRFPVERELLDGDGDSSATAGCAQRTRHMVGATGCGSNPTSRGRGPRTASFIHPQLDTGASRGGTTRQMRRKRIKATVTGGAM